MPKLPERVVVIGLDAPITKSILRCIGEGKMPHVARLVKEGVWCDNCLVPHPTITPPNWTTIATGAWPGTHGITCFHLHEKGLPLNREWQAFNSNEVKAEFIWEAVARGGKKAIVFNYPTSWPPRIQENLVMVAGCGLHANERRVDKEFKGVPGWGTTVLGAKEQLVSTEEFPFADVIEPQTASGWQHLPSGKFLEAKIKIGYRSAAVEIVPKEIHLLIENPSGAAFEKVSAYRSKDYAAPIFRIGAGEWSEVVTEDFVIGGRPQPVSYRAKLLALGRDGSPLKLFFSPFSAREVLASPEAVSKELATTQRFPCHVEADMFHMGWLDPQTYSECVDMDNDWLAEAAVLLMKRQDWSLFYMHAHCPDHTYHGIMNLIEPTENRDAEKLRQFTEVETRFYITLDSMIGKIVDQAGPDVMVAIVSDHGAVPTFSAFDKNYPKFWSANLVLEKEGLLVMKPNPSGQGRVVDWTRTRAYAQRSVYIYVNLKGRDPDGIVEPGEEYERVREQIIQGLMSYRDPRGKMPVAFALRKEDARIIGLHGDRVGDVVYGVYPEVAGEHGRQLTTGEYGVGSMKGLLILHGPNIKAGAKLQRTVWITDLVPTVCYLAGFPVPQEAEGAIIYQAMDDPDIRLHEAERLRTNYARVKSALEGQKSLTHSYE